MRDMCMLRSSLKLIHASIVGYVIKLNDKQTVNDGGVKHKGSR